MRTTAAVLLMLAGCANDATPFRDWGPLKSTMESASHVEAFRIRVPVEDLSYPDWPVTAGPIAVDAPTSEQLTGILLDPKSFTKSGKGCKPRPGVKVRWVSGPRQVEMVFCFECAMLWIYSEEAQGAWRGFDPAEAALVGVMKKIFPKDPQIQALK